MSVKMSTKKYKTYTDAQKAAYYKQKAAKAGSYRASAVRANKSKAYYKYKAAKDEAAAKEKAANQVRPPGIISEGGKFLGDLIHPAVGFLGGKIGHLIEKITGFGDYKVQYNSILKGGMSPAQIVNSVNNGGIIVRHREYLGDIVATQNFTVQSFLIQPGLVSSFPWLSQVANAYEQYQIRGMLFEFNSTSSDALLSTSTSTALGTVTMMTDYDVADPAPTSKRQMLNSEFSCSSKPSCTFIHPIECKRSQTATNMLYTRGAIAVPSGFDQRLYDFARFNIATEGMQANGGVLGELWVTYEIHLLKSQFTELELTDHFRISNVTTARPLGTDSGTSIATGSTLGGSLSSDGLSYLFPPNVGSGYYMVSYSVIGSSTAGVMSPYPNSYVNCVSLPLFNNNTINSVTNPNVATTSNIVTTVTLLKVTGPNAKITYINSLVVPGGTNGGDIIVTRISSTLS